MHGQRVCRPRFRIATEITWARAIVGSDMTTKPELGDLGYAVAALSSQGKFVRIADVCGGSAGSSGGTSGIVITKP